MSEKYFNEKYFESFKDNDRVSSLFDLNTTDINKIVEAGFEFKYSDTSFYSNIVIGDVKYNLKISWYDNYLILLIKKETDSYNSNNIKFYARRKNIASNGTTNTYSHDIDTMFFRFEQWIKSAKLAHVAFILKKKIVKFGVNNQQNATVDVNYQKGDDIVTKISQQNVYVARDGKTKTLDYSYLDMNDILILDKIIVEKLEEYEKNKGLNFKDFVNNEKNTIQ